MDVKLGSLINSDGPSSLTVITTYRCTAACEQCCFESSPKLKTRLTLAEIKTNIINAKKSFPNLELVVFTGGECFMLGQDLFDSIALASQLGLKTRCVTNAYWGSSKKKASKIAHELKQAGLTEINISSGIDHQEWVSKETVLNSSEALVKEGIKTLVTIEKDTKDSKLFEEIVEDKLFKSLQDSTNLLSAQTNSWMPFKENYVPRDDDKGKVSPHSGCEQIFNNAVITPHNLLSACCGLTLEYIPEVKLGDMNHEDLGTCYKSQYDDFMKIWIGLDGPFGIIKKVMGENYLNETYGDVEHPCHACVYLHKDDNIVSKITENADELVSNVVKRMHLQRALKLAHENN